MNIFRALRDSLRSLLRRDVKPSFVTRIVSDVPERLDAGLIYLVGEDGHYWQVALNCPCGCHAVIHLNLVPPGPPLWGARLYEDGRLTISPSIWRSVGCYSHFWIRRGHLMWVGRGQPPPWDRASHDR